MSEALITLIILGVTVVVFIWDRLPVMLVALAVPVALWATGVLDLAEAFKGFGDPTVIFIAALFVVSEALDATGVTAWVGDLALRLAGESRTRLLVVILLLVALVGDAGPYALLAGLFVVTTTLGQLISNMATAFIVVPVGLAAAIQMDVSPAPILMAIAVFAAAALLTPVATPANLVVMEAAGYRFGDYWKLGLPLLGLYGLVGIGLVPLFMPF